MRTPLSRVLGLGSAKDGTGHWWGQRVSAVALVVLTIWLLASLVSLNDSSHAQVVAWVASPWNAIALVLFLSSMFYHSYLGIQVVVEDYIHHDGVKVVTLILSGFLHALLVVAGVFAVLRIALGGQ
ncbi:MAG: succinate dehydrogenase, hydrophobic membrane anchor protein [Pseudomonadota bacterium]